MVTGVNFDDLENGAFIDAQTLARVLGVKPNTVWRRSAAGDLPKPIKFSTRCTRWNVGQIRKALADKTGAPA